MSVAAVTWALYEVRDVSPADKLALVVLAEHAAPDGTGAWPSWARIAEVAGVSRRTVARTMDGLEKRGLIRRGDQSRSVEALRAAGKDPRWAPVVWDLVMDGSHSARTQRGLPPVVDEDRDQHRSAESPQVSSDATLAPLDPGRSSATSSPNVVAGQQGCQDGTPVPSPPDKACHPEHASSAAGDTQNQEKIQETTTKLTDVNGATDGVVVDAHDLAVAIRDALPAPLRTQIRVAVLARKCTDLAPLGWTAADLNKATAEHSWAGAGPGAVIAWARDIRSQESPGTERARHAHDHGLAVQRERERMARIERERIEMASPSAKATRLAARNELAELLETRSAMRVRDIEPGGAIASGPDPVASR